MKKTLVFLILVLIVVAFLPPAKAGNGEVTLAELKKDIAYLIKAVDSIDPLLKDYEQRIKTLELCQPQSNQSAVMIADHEQRIRVIEKDMEGIRQIKGLTYGLIVSLLSAVSVSVINLFLYARRGK
jgi:hypothetical protein